MNNNTYKEILDKLKNVPKNLSTILEGKSNNGHRHDKSEIDNLNVDAVNIPIADEGNNFTSENVEDVLVEINTKAKENATNIQATQSDVRTIQNELNGVTSNALNVARSIISKL